MLSQVKMSALKKMSATNAILLNVFKTYKLISFGARVTKVQTSADFYGRFFNPHGESPWAN